MKISLKQTGGILGRTKTAQVETDLSEKEFLEILNTVEADTSGAYSGSDRLQYFLGKEDTDEERQIDISKIPLEWQHLFSQLFRQLRVPPAS